MYLPDAEDPVWLYGAEKRSSRQCLLLQKAGVFHSDRGETDLGRNCLSHGHLVVELETEAVPKDAALHALLLR